MSDQFLKYEDGKLIVDFHFLPVDCGLTIHVQSQPGKVPPIVRFEGKVSTALINGESLASVTDRKIANSNWATSASDKEPKVA